MTALCDICQRPIWTGMAQPTGLHHFCTCDCRDRFTWGLRCEIVRLRGLVEKAYEEGAEDVGRGMYGEGPGANWEASEVRREMEKEG